MPILHHSFRTCFVLQSRRMQNVLRIGNRRPALKPSINLLPGPPFQTADGEAEDKAVHEEGDCRAMGKTA